MDAQFIFLVVITGMSLIIVIFYINKGAELEEKATELEEREYRLRVDLDRTKAKLAITREELNRAREGHKKTIAERDGLRSKLLGVLREIS